MLSRREKVREKIVQTYLNNPLVSQSIIALQIQSTQSTVSRVIKRFLETNSFKHFKGGGRRKGFANKKLVADVLKTFKSNPQLSLAAVAKIFACSKSHVARIKKNCKLRTYRNVKQQIIAKSRARKLHNYIHIKKFRCIIMDDKTCVKTVFKQMPEGYNYHVSRIGGLVNKKYRHILTEKFAQKYMVWQAICSCGRKCKPFIFKGTMTSKRYIKECLQKRLLPIIRSHKKSVLFWPDLTSYHYSKATLNWFLNNSINVVAQSMNPPNNPKLRPIANFWPLVKNILIRNKHRTKYFKTKLKISTSKVTKFNVKTLMRDILKNIRMFVRGQL